MAGSTGVHDTVVNQLLSKIDGVEQLNNILVIGMMVLTFPVTGSGGKLLIFCLLQVNLVIIMAWDLFGLIQTE